MSLKELASTMSAQGRGPDDVLVHMSSKELAGLQGLALAAGGSLTINPKTGLPEAGFLDSLLPSILGFAANFVLPGSGMFVGAATGAMQNKENPLMGALLGGMGGYGAGQLAGGLGSLGTEAAKTAAMTQAVPQATAAHTAALAQAQPTLSALQGPLAPGAVPLGMNEAGNLAAQAAADTYTGAANAAAKEFANKSVLDRLSAGAQAAWDKPSSVIDALGGPKAAMKSGLMAAAPMALYQPEFGLPDEATAKGKKYRYDAGATGAVGSPYYESTYFRPTFTELAEGGEVEDKTNAGLPAVAPDVTQGKMTGQSADAFRYLMGQIPDTRSFAPPMPAPPAAGTAINPDALTPGQKYALVSDGAGGYSYESNPANVSLSPGYSVTDGIQAGLNTPLGGALAWGASKLGLLGNMQSGTQAPVTDLSSYGSDAGYGGYGGATDSGDGTGGGFGVGSVGSSGEGEASDGLGWKKGGIVDLKSGGFVVPADVVSALGNGSSSAGLAILAKMGAKPIKGKGDGQSDSIKAKIDGKHRAAVAREEAYFTPEQVKKMGGAKKLYAMLDKIRIQAHGKKTQQRPVNPRAALA